MTVEQVIKKAIEGGFLPTANIKRLWLSSDGSVNDGIGEGTWFKDYRVIFSLPEFWKALSNAMRWPDRVSYKPIKVPLMLTEHDWMDVPQGSQEYVERVAGWKWEWHRFIDHLADGKSTEEFFSNLENRT